VDASFVSQASFYDYAASDTKASSLSFGDDGSVALLGTFRVANDSWPYALTRLVDYGPPTLTSLGYFGTSGFWFTLNLVEGQTARLQASTNLQHWDDLLALTGGPAPITVGDPAARFLPRRFYRLATP